MNTKAIIPLVAGLCIGGFALKMVFDTVQKAKGAQTKMTKVWAAGVDIPLGADIDESMIRSIAFPTTAVPAGAITDKTKVLGRVPRIPAAAGNPILESMLLPPGSKPGLWVKKGYRAVAVRIDESSGVDNHLWPGCRVDVVGYFTTRRQGKAETVARTLIENVEVAAVGPQLSVVSTEDPGAKSSAKAKPARAVTLFVTPEKVPTLHLAEQRGKIKLSMRSEEDGEMNRKERSVSETALLDEEPEQDPDNSSSQPLADRFGDMFKKFFGGEPASKPEPKLAEVAVKPQSPTPMIASALWEVVVWNGGRQEVLRWADPNSRKRIDGNTSGFGTPPVAPPTTDTPDRLFQNDANSDDDTADGDYVETAPEEQPE